MQKLAVSAVVGALVLGAFLAGVAVGKATPPQPKFVAVEELKWDDLGGTKLALLVGDLKKGPYGALLRLPSGWTSPVRAHTGAYEAVEISGTSSHWMKGEDGTKAKKMTPGSYWTIPAKTEHVSACAPGADCVIYMWQKAKYDVVFAKDTDKGGLAGKVTGSGSAAVPVGATAGSAAKAAASTAAGATSGSAAGGTSGKAGTAAPAAPATAPKSPGSGAGAGSQSSPKK